MAASQPKAPSQAREGGLPNTESLSLPAGKGFPTGFDGEAFAFASFGLKILAEATVVVCGPPGSRSRSILWQDLNGSAIV